MAPEEFKEKYGEFLVEGSADEDRAAKVIVENLGGVCYHTDPEIDIKCHTDLIWVSNKGTVCAIDKKSQKKISRGDDNPSKTLEWFEMRSVNGDPGSATPMTEELKKFGIEVSDIHDYIMQETDDKYLFLQRCVLSRYIKDRTDLEHPVRRNPKRPYVAYQRPNRNDLIVLVPIKDLENIKHFSIDKR